MIPNKKQKVFERFAQLLEMNTDAVVAANKRDLDACQTDDPVILDRLKFDAAKVAKAIETVNVLGRQEDPCDRVLYSKVREDGLRIENRTVPFGTVLVIYEARPDVTVEATAIAVLSGNRILLKGGAEARQTNLALCGIWRLSLADSGADEEMFRYLDYTREETRSLIEGKGPKFDVIIPRGGDELIDFVVTHAKVPVIVSGRGNNFAFIDRDADFEKALAVVLNGKSRLSVCNALDKVLIDASLPDLASKIRTLIDAFRSMGVDVIGDANVSNFDPSIVTFGEDAWHEEFLSAKIALAVVDGLGDAIARINKYSGGHSASILTESDDAAAKFMHEVDCGAVYHNASTRFTDGGEFGLGAEIAISTQKLHFRGPLGASHMLTNKWFVYGNGHVR